MPAYDSPHVKDPALSSALQSDLVLPTRSYSAFLFDMDGTILNSIASAERVWGRWALAHGLDLETFLPFMHGKRGIDTITSLNLPGVDPAVEAEKILRGEIDDVEGVVALPGAAEFLAKLPADRWTIVTSSPLELCRARLRAAGLSEPALKVTAEDVTIGKPDPQGYRLGASRLGMDPADVLVFEDVPAGIKAGEAAGSEVMVITATHNHKVEGGRYRITDYRGLVPHVGEDGRISIRREG